MKKKFLLVLALLSALTITGCDDSDKKLGTLSAPQEVIVKPDGDRSLIIFDEVENAEYYNIYINDVAITVKSSGSGTIQFDASKIINLPKTYTVKVKACADKYFDSTFTDADPYEHTNTLQAPIINVDGTNLNWNKVTNASFYEIVVDTFNPNVTTKHRSSTNSFNFSKILLRKGEYVFKVRAFSENNEYLTSSYSNQIKYTHSVDIITPYNLASNYDMENKELMLSFVSSEGVKDFTIKINNISYSLREDEISKFLYNDDFKNVYILKLTSFIKSKNIEVDNSRVLNVSVKANAIEQYVNSSNFSNTIACQIVSVLPTPKITITNNTKTCIININQENSPYLSGYDIYLNDLKYKPVPKEIKQVEIPISEIGNCGIRVQAVSNNNNCKSSNLSDVKYLKYDLIDTQENISIEYSHNVISWNSVLNSANYYVEIYNDIYRHSIITAGTNLDISNLATNKYNVKVIAMANGYKQIEKNIEINCNIQLDDINNATISKELDATYLQFDKVENAYGYVIYLDNVMVDKLFVEPKINVSLYFNSAKTYKVKVKAVDLLNNHIIDSNLSEEHPIQNIVTLPAPVLKIDDSIVGEYYLDINIDEEAATLSSPYYEVWIDYEFVGEYTYQDYKINVTTQMNNAGEHHFMVKLNPVAGNTNVKPISESITYVREKQLDTVKNISVIKNESEGTYILTFERNILAKYNITIVKQGNENNPIKLNEINDTSVDISGYVTGNGVYKIDVEAVPLDSSSPYYASGPSGNPYRLTKGETLTTPVNITVNRRSGSNANGEIDLTWNRVTNSLGYQVYVYYNTYGKNILKKSVFVPQTQNPNINIGTGTNKCLNKEGIYTIQIKAIGDGTEYVNSQISTYAYEYSMQTQADFERGNIYIYGKTYTYSVSSAEELKNLLWYHYLYNQDTWKYDTFDYNLKIYCDLDLDKLALEVSQSIFDEMAGLTTNQGKMKTIALALLRQYPEMAVYSYDVDEFCLNKEKNVYIFRYQDLLDQNKLKEIKSTKQVYNERVDVIDEFDKRIEQYVFKIDSAKNTIDVTTTEQLFMALQYNCRPNFVGDSAVAEAVYQNARFILRQICTDSMTDYEKTLAIYNFLTQNVIYNYPNVPVGGASGQITATDGVTMLGNIKDFYLESILYNENNPNGLFEKLSDVYNKIAVCNGIAKTFVALCSIEGIDCIKVEGTLEVAGNTAGTTKKIAHAWNKVYLDVDTNDNNSDKKWYVVDISSAINYTMKIGTADYQTHLHKYFLISDTSLPIQATKIHKRLGDSTDYVANEAFDYYQNQKYSCIYEGTTIVNQSNFVVTDDASMKNALMYAMLKANKSYRYMVDIDAESYIKSLTGSMTEADAIATVSGKITGSIYSSANTALGGKYRCSVEVKIIDLKYIVLAVQGNNYNG